MAWTDFFKLWSYSRQYPLGFEHRHDGYNFSILDGFGVEEKEKPVDPILQISESYLKSLEDGRRIQSRTVDNYLRIQFAVSFEGDASDGDIPPHMKRVEYPDRKTEIEDRIETGKSVSSLDQTGDVSVQGSSGPSDVCADRGEVHDK